MQKPKKKDVIQYSAGLLAGFVILGIPAFVFLLNFNSQLNDFIGNSIPLKGPGSNWTHPIVTPTAVPTITATPAAALPGTTSTPVPTVVPTQVPTTPVPSQGTFRDSATGQVMNPRGTNYVKMGTVLDPFSGGNVTYQATFDPGLYNAGAASTNLAKMRTDGYNFVRVFISDNGVGDPSGAGLKASYMNNVVDFLKKANDNQMGVMFTLLFLPKAGGKYYWSSSTDSAAATDVNWIFLTRSGLNGKKAYATDFINYLKNNGAPTNRIFSIELENELHFVENKIPLSRTSGNFVGLNGVTYNLASQTSKNQLMDSSLASWLNEMTDTVRALLPNTLVSSGFFSPYAVGGSDPRVIRTYWAMVPFNEGGSKLDFVDLHIYTQSDFNKSIQELNSFEIPRTSRKKLIMFGETGVFTGIFGNITQGAQSLKTLMRYICANNLGEGYAAWTWDTTQLGETYNILQSSEAINSVIKPRSLPNPCQ